MCSSHLFRDKDKDEGIPSETEDDKRQLESKAKEIRGEKNTSNRLLWKETPKVFFIFSSDADAIVCFCRPDMLKQKDTEIISLLEEKVLLFREMWEGFSTSEEAYRQVEPFFRSACSQESIMKDALQEGKTEEVKLVVFVV